MKTSCLVAMVATWAACVVTTGAQQPQAAPSNQAGDPWIISTFRVSPLSLRNKLPIAVGEKIPPSAPGSWDPVLSDFPVSPGEFLALPPAGASEKEWAAHIQRTSTVLAGILESCGAPGLRDHTFLYDAPTSTLAVRTTEDHLQELESVLNWLKSDIPHDLTFVVHVVQADSTFIRSLVEETTGCHEHASAWSRCAERLATGKAKTVGQYRWSGRTGQRAVLKSGQESVPLKALQVDASGRVLAIRDAAHSTLHLEADPEDPIDRFSESTLHLVDVPLMFRFDYAPPVERLEKITGLLGSSTIDAPMLDYNGAQLITTKLPMYVGSQRLLTVWRPRGTPEFAGNDVMQAAFLQVDAQAALPRENASLAETLRKHAGPPPASSKKPASTGTADPGDVFSRTFKVPARFTEALKLSEGDSNVQSKLETAGIPFPKGSEATYISANNSLIVRTTRSSLERIEAYVKEVSGPTAQLVSTTAYIIEGDSSTIQELTSQARNQTEHSQVWDGARKLIDTNTLRIVEVIRSEARLGDRASFEFGTTRHNTGEILLNDTTDSEMAPEGTEKEKGKDNGASTDQSPGQGKSPTGENSPVTLQIETSFEGTRMEWQALEESGDRETVTLHLSFYHDTAPTAELQISSSPGSITPAGLPKTRFHYSEITSATRIRSGTTRLMGSWKKGEPTAQNGRDLSQALFLRLDLIPFEAPGA